MGLLNMIGALATPVAPALLRRRRPVRTGKATRRREERARLRRFADALAYQRAHAMERAMRGSRWYQDQVQSNAVLRA